MDSAAFKILETMEDSWWYRGRALVVRSILARSGAPKGKRALDVGAGFGGMFDTILRYAENVDALEVHRDSHPVLEKRGYTTVYADIKDTMQRYDLVTMFDVLEHIEDDRGVVKDIFNRLSPGGHLVITVPAFQFLWSVHDTLHHHYRRYRRPALRSILEEVGFTVEVISYWNSILFIPVACARLLNMSGEGSLQLPKTLDAVLYFLVRLESFVLRFISLPFGVSIVLVARKNA